MFISLSKQDIQSASSHVGLQVFRKNTLLDIAFHLRLLRETLEVYKKCLCDGRNDLLVSFPVLFVAHLNIILERLCTTKAAAYALQNDIGWDEFSQQLTHHIGRIHGFYSKDKSFLKDPDVNAILYGSIWARYPHQSLESYGKSAIPLGLELITTKQWNENCHQQLMQLIVNSLHKIQAELKMKKSFSFQMEDLIEFLDSKTSTSNSEALEKVSIYDEIQKNLEIVEKQLANQKYLEAEKSLVEDEMEHLHHLKRCVEIFKEFPFQNYLTFHTWNLVWDTQFFLEENFKAEAVHQGKNVIASHELQSLSTNAGKKLNSEQLETLHHFDISMGTTTPFLRKNAISSSNLPKALELLLSGYYLSKVPGEEEVPVNQGFKVNSKESLTTDPQIHAQELLQLVSNGSKLMIQVTKV